MSVSAMATSALPYSQVVETPSTWASSSRASSSALSLCACSCVLASRSVRPTVVMVAALFCAQRGQLLGLVFAGQRADHFVQVAGHDVIKLVQRQVDAVVGDPALGEIVGTNALGAVAAADQLL